MSSFCAHASTLWANPTLCSSVYARTIGSLIQVSSVYPRGSAQRRITRSNARSAVTA